MGRIRTKSIKKITEKILEEHTNVEFTANFEENKKILNEIAEFPSKVIRNKVAGYITFLKKKELKAK